MLRLKLHAGRVQDIVAGGALVLILGAMLLILYLWTAKIPVRKYASDTFDHYDDVGRDSDSGWDYEGRGDGLVDPDCSLVPVGVDNILLKISDSKLSASSTVLGGEASRGRLNFKAVSGSQGAWVPEKQDKEQWIQVDLGRVLVVGGVVTQGEDDHVKPNFVRSFKLQHSLSGEYWDTYTNGTGHHRLFVGNTNGKDPVQNKLESAIRARYIRLSPQEWENKIALRFEVLRCADKF